MIDKLVDGVVITGYRIVQQALKIQDEKHVAHILLRLPYDVYNKALLRHSSYNFSEQSQTAFDILGQRLEKHRQQMAQDVDEKANKVGL